MIFGTVRFWKTGRALPLLMLGVLVGGLRADAQAGTLPAGGQPMQVPGQNSGTAPRASSGDQGGSTKTANAAPGELAALAPAPPPPGPVGRKRIGLALGGGGALAMSEIGALQWFEEHHIPVDMIAGTSMGSMVGALYSTGKTIDELKVVMNDDVFNQVFRIASSYKSRSFRRREDSRELPNALTVGLKHGVSLRNSVLTDQGLNGFLDREFLRYDDQTEFNSLPIPFRALSTDLTDAKPVTFARGSLPDAVRASVSLPGVYRPFELNGHEYVDGGVLENLPTRTVRDMKADVVLAVSLPLEPVGKNDLNSILGVLARSFSVAIEANEAASRKLADVVIMPDIAGFSATDYLRTKELAQKGYEAAEKQKALLMPYALSDADWAEYLAERNAKLHGPAGTLLQVRVKAPNEDTQHVVEARFRSLLNQPVDTKKVEALLEDIRSDGRFDADYSVTYETRNEHRPVLLVTVADKKTGPPFVLVGANIEAQTGGVTRATIEGTIIDQDFLGYGSELRGHVKMGYETNLDAEYYRKLPTLFGVGDPSHPGGFFIAPRLAFTRKPYQIYDGNTRVAERLLTTFGGGGDLAWSDQRKRELRAGWEVKTISWHENIGQDTLPDVKGSAQRARIRYVYDEQDKALVPQFGIRVVSEGAYLYNAAGSVSAPQITTSVSLAHTFSKNIVILGLDGGTMFNRNVGQPYRFTLGGPMRLSASVIDQYRGTDYFLVQPAMLRRIASLPQVLGQSIYAGAVYEAGQMRGPDMRTITRQDVMFGVVAETPIGIISIGPALGDGGNQRLVFTLGKLF
jgi:NTE family protein